MSRIAIITVVAGVVLILVSGVAYALSDSGSVTSLIPAGIGVLLAICGAVSRTPKATLIAMHFAVIVALIGASSLGMAFAKMSTLLEERPLAFYAMLITGTICTALLITYIASFIASRKKPEAA